MKIPQLDDREFTEIFEEARRQLPVHSEEWTNHNPNDTGIAILEVLAWLSETYSYQLDTITDADWQKFLQLLGISRHPPEPATVELSATVSDAVDGFVIPAGEKLVADDQSGGKKTFETILDETLVSERLERVVTQAGGDTVNNTMEAETANTTFAALGEDPQAGNAMYLGFDGDPLSATKTRNTLELTIDYYDADLPDPATHGDRPSRFEPTVELEWEFCTDYDNWDDDESWASLSVLRDETNSLYSGGVVRLAKPEPWTVDQDTVDSVSVLDQEPGLVWIRCRLEEAGYEILPLLTTIRLNVIDIAHQATVTDELLHRADETLETTIQAGQEYFFDQQPVLEAEIVVDGEQWTEVTDFDRSGPTDRHYVLDNRRGSVTFGNGINGTKPPVGEHVLAERYVHGGGADGNVTASTEWEFKEADKELQNGVTLGDIDISQMGPATGGADMESIDEALERFRRDLKETYRASTLDDYRYIATRTPGLRFGRAHATTEQRETVTGETVDEIQVTVVPYSTRPRPQPSDGFRNAVQEHLDRNRLVTDVVRVVDPTYVTIGGTIVVSVVPGYSDADVIRDVQSELTTYLHPLSGYDGTGWPFGQLIYTTNVEEIVETLPSVQAVDELGLTASGEADLDEYGNIQLPEAALPTLVEDDLTIAVTSEGTGGNRR
jgi:predicted phage baseplate assembly protein